MKTMKKTKNLASKALLLSLLSSVLFFGCSRSSESETSEIKLLVPQVMSHKNGASSGTEELAHVVINVTGSGITQPIYYIWDQCHHCTTATASPTSFDLLVPTGSDRLFQVLAVYKNSDTSIMTFYYGDQTQSLSQAAESVAVPITSFSTGAISGSVFGRYLDTATSGPTGVVDIRFNPGSGKPALLIEKTQILNGWFNFFMLTSTPLQYVMDSGRVLFDGPASLDQTKFLPSANNPNVMRVTLPAHQRNSGSWDTEQAEVMTYGWFSDAATSSVLSGKAVCRPSTLSTMTKLAKYDNTSSFLTGSLDVTLPSSSALQDVGASSLSQYFVNGGVMNSHASCTGGNVVYTNFLSFVTSMIDGNGKDGAAPFDAPFEKDASGNVFTITTSGNRVVSAKILPGLIGRIESVKIFKKVTNEDLHLDKISCAEISAGLGGFTEAGVAIPDGSGNVTITTSITSAEATSGTYGAVCSTMDGKMIPFGNLIYSHSFSSGSAVPADGMDVSLSWSNLTVNQCFNGEIMLKNGANNHNVTNSLNHTIQASVLGLTAGTMQVYAAGDTTCSSPLASQTLTLNAPATKLAFRYKITGGSAPMSPMIRFHTSSFGSLDVDQPISYGSPSVAAKLDSRMTNSSLSVGYCMPIDLFRVDAAGFVAPSGGGETVTRQITPSTDLGTYSNDACSTPATSFTFGIGEFTKRIYVKRLAGNTEATILFQSDAAISDFVFYANPVAWVSYLTVEARYGLAGAFLGTSECLPVNVKGYDAGNALVTSLPGPMSVSVSVPRGFLYTNQTNCNMMSGGAPSQAVTLGSGLASSSDLWYRDSSGGGSLMIAAGGGNEAFRVSNPAASLGYSISSVSTLSAQASPLPAPIANFSLDGFATIATGSGVGVWNDYVNSRTLTDLALGTTPYLSTNGGIWRGIQFAGSGGSGAALSTGNVLSLGDFTLAMRVRFTSAGTAEGIAQFYGSTCTSCALTRNANGSLSWFSIMTSANAIADTAFHTVVVYRNGTNVGIFIDGVSHGSGAISGPETENPLTTLKVGYTNGSIWLNGTIGDVILYNSDQSTNQMMLHNYLSAKFP